MQRAWCGLLFCAAMGAQVPKVAATDDLALRIKEARERASAGRVNSALTLGRSGDVMLDANPATARSQAVMLLQRPPDPRQTLASLAERVALLDDDGLVLDAAAARTRAALLARANTSFEQLQGIKTIVGLREALVTGNDQRRLMLVLPCAAISPGEPSTMAALLRCLDAKDPELRWRSALGISWAQGSAAAREAVPALVERLGDADPTVRAFAAGALGKIAPLAKELVPALTALERAQDGIGRQVAAIVRGDLALREQRARTAAAGTGNRGGRGQVAVPAGPPRTTGVPSAPPRSTTPAPASQPSTRKRREIG